MIEAHDFTAGIMRRNGRCGSAVCKNWRWWISRENWLPPYLQAAAICAAPSATMPRWSPIWQEAEHFSEEEVLDFLRRRQGLLDGVVLSGGEPLLHDGVGAFLRKVRGLGFAVKLDTNGCFPDALASLLEEELLDYVAMDIKNQPEKYPLTVRRLRLDTAPVRESVRILQARSGVDYEFRTTAVRELHTAAGFSAPSAAGWRARPGTSSRTLWTPATGGPGYHGFSPHELQALRNWPTRFLAGGTHGASN